MLPVIYSMSMSLDGFNARPTCDIGWTAPDAGQFRFHIEQTRHVAAHRCGRGLYQEKLVWETAGQTMSGEAELEFARIWRPIPKVVFSPDAEFGGRHCAAGHRRHRHRGRLPSLPAHALSLAPRNTCASMWWKGAVSQRSKKFL